MDWYLYEQQFSPPQRTVAVSGLPPFEIGRQELVGDYLFKWFVSGAALQRQLVVQQRGGGITAGAPGADQAIGGVPGGEPVPGAIPGF